MRQHHAWRHLTLAVTLVRAARQRGRGGGGAAAAIAARLRAAVRRARGRRALDRTLDFDGVCQVAIAVAGGIAPLVVLTCGGTVEQKEYATAALANLAFRFHNQGQKLMRSSKPSGAAAEREA